MSTNTCAFIFIMLYIYESVQQWKEFNNIYEISRNSKCPCSDTVDLEMFKYGECLLILEPAWIANSVFGNDRGNQTTKTVNVKIQIQCGFFFLLSHRAYFILI